MTIETRLFGSVDVDKNKVIRFPQGIVGFPELTEFVLLYNAEHDSSLSFLQSLQEPAFALPVVDPAVFKDDYNPQVSESIEDIIGELNEDNLLLFTTMAIPSDIRAMSINLMAPIIVNGDSKLGIQVILENQDEYPVKFPVYEILRKK